MLAKCLGLWQQNKNDMATKTEHTVYVRKVSKDVYHSLKRMAKKNNQSLNGFMLSNLSFATEDERKEHKQKILSKLK